MGPGIPENDKQTEVLESKSRIPKLIGLELMLNRARQSNRTRFKLIRPDLKQVGPDFLSGQRET